MFECYSRKNDEVYEPNMTYVLGCKPEHEREKFLQDLYKTDQDHPYILQNGDELYCTTKLDPLNEGIK